METAPHSKEDDNQSQEGLNPWEAMVREVLDGDSEHETAEKKYYEMKSELSPDEIIMFREELLNASPEDLATIIKSRVALLEEHADKVEYISPLRFKQYIHRGYISRDTTIEFDDTIGAQYKIKDLDYLREAIQCLQRNKEKINSGLKLFNNIFLYLNSYFGVPKSLDSNNRENDTRWDIINRKKNLSDLEDDEYWDAINNIDISIFKGEYSAMCSERSALAQNLMSFFGYESYYINGHISVDGDDGGHAYTVVADTNGAKCLIDYSTASSVSYRHY